MTGIKKLFSSSKKTAVTLVCAGVILVALGVCIVAYAAGGPDRSSAIGRENARNCAFADAGVDPVDARAVSVEYERYQGGFVYEVEFTAGGTEYKYKIDAEDGSVVKKESKTVQANDGGASAVTLAEAQAIALADAGLTPEQVEFTAAESGAVYQIKFHTENTEYTYEINPQTGAVYSKSTVIYAGQAPDEPPAQNAAPVQSADPIQSAAPVQSSAPAQTAGPDAQDSLPPAGSTPSSAPVTTPQPAQQPSGQTYIDVNTAKSTALADAGVDASQATFTKARMDHEDHVVVYELEFRTATHKYEYEINAATGAIYNKSAEALNTSGNHHSGQHHDEPQSSSAVLIGMDAAKNAALAHAGCSAGEVTFTKTELDYDGGRAVYEIEFRKGRAEYEYEIDAATGAVLEYDWDLD